eukprot:gnl/MRDRNA2_/MRDRNA2_152602_c0_seq1.p1 gnl/MRDRNA2_/MRDRNA2_152602_c0~~gnl/MRDRNA2_/MRDRNA2_152602_c0_seq1.p1  ORF type:complete len:213 (-),score=22.64 gnl/MRDRNA2_/MRDRNA2_152602_c0_seq1:36-674(-)
MMHGGSRIIPLACIAQTCMFELHRPTHTVSRPMYSSVGSHGSRRTLLQSNRALDDRDEDFLPEKNRMWRILAMRESAWDGWPPPSEPPGPIRESTRTVFWEGVAGAYMKKGATIHFVKAVTEEDAISKVFGEVNEMLAWAVVLLYSTRCPVWKFAWNRRFPNQEDEEPLEFFAQTSLSIIGIPEVALIILCVGTGVMFVKLNFQFGPLILDE